MRPEWFDEYEADAWLDDSCKPIPWWAEWGLVAVSVGLMIVLACC